MTATTRPPDPVVLITGSTGGTGRIVARTFADDGWRVALSGSDEARLTELASDLGLGAGRWAPAVGDLRDADAARRAVVQATSHVGRIDAVVHLVGGWAGSTPVAELDPADIVAMLDQHLWTIFHVAQAVLPGMVERGWGRLVGVTVPFVATPNAKGAPYAIGKAAEETLLRTIARETADTGVTANLVVVKKIDADHAREQDPSPKNAAWTTPEEIAAAMRFLCTDEAAAINGARVPLDGR
jgi:NAD(P)-dependent dehydrogenase (short-subunit alcohol dehydrogenase family)